MPSERGLFFSDGENQRTIESQSFDGGALSIAVSTGSNNILNNPASDAFSSTIAQQ